MTGVCSFIIAASAGFLWWTSPTTSDCTYETGGAIQHCEIPLRVETTENVQLHMWFTLRTNVFSPSMFLIVPDDCLQELIINGQSVNDPSFPLCDYTDGKKMDLGAFLKHGNNRIEAVLHNNGGNGGMRFQAVWSNASIAVPLIVCMLMLGFLAAFFLRRHKVEGWKTALIVLFAAAVLLRGYYLSITPYSLRTYDVDGHIEYIEYVAHNRALPAANHGWETWQPPLYYTASAAVYDLIEVTGSGRQTLLLWMQIIGFFLSIWTLLLSIQIGLQFCKTKQERAITLPVFFSLIAFNPALVMLSSRINNDVLVVPLMFLSTLLIVRWWKHHSIRLWYGAMIAIGCCILTKSSGLLLLPVAFGCLIATERMSWRKKLREGVMGLCIVLLIAGWFNIYRTIQDKGTFTVVANVNALNDTLRVDNDIKSFLTLNPVRMVKIPFVSAWEDDTGRNNFWEYVFRTGLFGEFDLGSEVKQMASWIVLWSFLIWITACIGCIRLFKEWKTWLPFFLITAVFTLGHAAFRFQNPFSPSQDFRHVFILLVPTAVYAAVLIGRTNSSILRTMLLLPVQFFVALSCMMLLSL